jgi:hypothetical protein
VKEKKEGWRIRDSRNLYVFFYHFHSGELSSWSQHLFFMGVNVLETNGTLGIPLELNSEHSKTPR